MSAARVETESVASESRDHRTHGATRQPGQHPTGNGGRGVSSLRNRQFRLLWFGLLFSQGAMQINMVARPWLAYHVSGSGAALGIVAVASGLPMALVSIMAVTIVDRADKVKSLLVVTVLL